ncbi:carnitine/acyl carnitine carrier [Pluteus cervinus]|uniref:Carnitine/acyl carnitine carrier n=1 Tax=Pluteus cervinus TaxID=181527 RepID=A0ACD3BGK3_9AGAR|nr:carnitine/acyl carnitine carrier [Pluteus cervinus]
MHWPPLPLCVLLSLISSPLVQAAQLPLGPTPSWQAQTSTLVDALSADPDYTSVLLLLQRARLIPTINRLDGATFFAPTNDAIKKHSLANSLWASFLQDDPPFGGNDNVKEQLRQQLFYHLLNYTISELPSDSQPSTHLTLHFPREEPPPSQDPPPSPPWLPEPEGTLGGEPQRLRLASRNSNSYVGVDAFGKGGIKVVKERVEAGNGVVYGINGVLETPPDLATIVAKQKQLSYFSKIITPEIESLLGSSENLTLFLPVDTAWDELDPYERLYLESEFAADDLSRIVNMHAVVETGVKWADRLEDNSKLKTIHGTHLPISISDGKTTISGAELVRPDVYASNGVAHLVSSLLIPPGTLKLTPEKYLLALKCTKFVSMLHSVNLTHLINDSEATSTILALPDDVLSIYKDEELPKPGTPELKRLLEYHFLSGKWSTSKLETGMLLETELKEEGLDGGRQVVNVEVVSDDKKKPSEKSVRFGGTSIVGDPVEVDDTLVYFVSRPLAPPADPLQVALPFLDLSAFLAAVFSTSQADILRTTPRVTLLIPHNSAFTRLGLLVSAHLLSPNAQPDLEKVLLHHAIDDVEYASSLKSKAQRTFPTLEGSDIQVEHLSNGTVYASPSGGWERMKTQLYLQDHLTKTGVVHELSDILIPRSVNLTIGKLVKAAKGSTMATMVNKAGLDWVLDGSKPPEGDSFAGDKYDGVSWTLLCPPDDAFKEFNLTQLYADVDYLKAIVMQHLILTRSRPKDAIGPSSDPLNNNKPISLDPSITYATLRSPASSYGDVVFRRLEESTEAFVVGIKGARGTNGQTDWARVLAWGRTTTGGGNGGVIQIDRLLLPYQPSWWIEYGGPTIVGAIGVILICAFFYGVRIIWLRDTMEATYEPLGGFGRDDLDDDGFSPHTTSLDSERDVLYTFFSFNRKICSKISEPTYNGKSTSPIPSLERTMSLGRLALDIGSLIGCRVKTCESTATTGFYRSDEAAPTADSSRNSAAENVKSFVAGGFGGVSAVLVGHPFDLIKTRLQTAPPGTYTGAIDAVKKTVARDGITGLYRGMVPPLLGVTPIFAVSFWAYDTSKTLIYAVTPNRTSSSLSIGELAAAGFLSAVPTTLVTAPVERAKVLLQVQGQGGSQQQYKGVFDVIKHLYREGGLRSIYRGTGATLARDGPGSAAYFAAYEVTKKALTPAGASSSELNLGAIIVAGGTAGVAMWAIAIPPDVLKSRLQSAPTGTYSGIVDCARKTIAQDGLRALWKGFGPAMARAFPANAATFLGVEASRSLMNKFF